VQLESLTHARFYAPAVWLGLSHLHTLRGVDFEVVSVSALAAALPRLHTLEAFISPRSRNPNPSAVAGFFEVVLPQLQAFHFRGPWPRPSSQPDEQEAQEDVVRQPLPLLQELTWHCTCDDSHVRRGFLGALPVMLFTSCHVIADWLTEAVWHPLARVRALHFSGASSLDAPSVVAGALRAAPLLQSLSISVVPDASHHMLTALADPAVMGGLVHRRLRIIQISAGITSHPIKCVTRFQRLQFPRLQQVTFNGKDVPLE
jgi:hypothetical protein